MTSRIKRVEDRRVIVDEGAEPVYEYRVVCDGYRVTPWIGTYFESVAAAARDRADAVCPWSDEEQHSHAIERRSIGPCRPVGPWETI